MNDQVRGARRAPHGCRAPRHGHRARAPTAWRSRRRSAACRRCSSASARRVFLPDEPYPRYFFAGATYAVRESGSLKLIAAPADLIANIDVLLEAEDFDLLHLNEPFVPGLGWSALRYAGCPLVATFHANPEKMRPFWSTRPQLRAPVRLARRGHRRRRPAARDAAARLVPRRVPGHPAGRRPDALPPGRRARRPGRCASSSAPALERRKGLGVLLRALRCWATSTPASSSTSAAATSRSAATPASCRPPRRTASASTGACRSARSPALCAAPTSSARRRSAPRRPASPCSRPWPPAPPCVASQIPGYDEVVQNEGTGLLVPPRDVARARGGALAPARRRRAAARLRRARARAPRAATTGSASPTRSWSVYDEVARRRRHPLPRRRRQQRELFADFHVHTHHSKDCVMPVADILERAREVGLDVVAITDHDSAAGGLEARELADRYGVRVIVGEEVKSSEGEVIGLFLERTHPRRHDLRRDDRRDQGAGRHRLRAAPVRPPAHHPAALRAARPTSPTSTCVEVFNSRLAFPGFNELAERFAAALPRCRPPPAATRTCCPASARRCAAWTTSPGRTTSSRPSPRAASSAARAACIYLQSLKLLQTTMGGAAKDDGQVDSPA